MPLPLVPLLILIGAGVVALTMSNDAQGTGLPADPLPPAPPDPPPADPTNPEPTPMPPRPLIRTPRYDQFRRAYAATPYHAIIDADEVRIGAPAGLLARLLYQESSFRPDAVGDGGKALGIAQFHAAAATDMGLKVAANPGEPDDRMVPELAIPAAANYLSWLNGEVEGDWYATLIAYNWGVGNVKKYGLDRAPQMAVNYANNILADTEVA